jgi:hypothetical protein
MNIKSIQTNEVVPVILRSSEKNSSRVDAGKGLSPESSALILSSSSASNNATQSSGIQSQALLSRINYMKDQLDNILVNFPPFFPAGSYQRIDLIKAIRGIQDEVESSSVQSGLKKEITSQKLSENATDKDISAALDNLLSLKDELSSNVPKTAESPQPGILVSIKV